MLALIRVVGVMLVLVYDCSETAPHSFAPVGSPARSLCLLHAISSNHFRGRGRLLKLAGSKRTEYNLPVAKGTTQTAVAAEAKRA